mmetsp:Transcript_99006/g.268921  ORF Transcript_99006/g.268921 Transcript_99006/m.268921 type:complete len:410 (-) Transcript_99006:368-1597(-)
MSERVIQKESTVSYTEGGATGIDWLKMMAKAQSGGARCKGGPPVNSMLEPWPLPTGPMTPPSPSVSEADVPLVGRHPAWRGHVIDRGASHRRRGRAPPVPHLRGPPPQRRRALDRGGGQRRRPAPPVHLGRPLRGAVPVLLAGGRGAGRHGRAVPRVHHGLHELLHQVGRPWARGLRLRRRGPRGGPLRLGRPAGGRGRRGGGVPAEPPRPEPGAAEHVLGARARLRVRVQHLPAELARLVGEARALPQHEAVEEALGHHGARQEAVGVQLAVAVHERVLAAVHQHAEDGADRPDVAREAVATAEAGQQVHLGGHERGRPTLQRQELPPPRRQEHRQPEVGELDALAPRLSLHHEVVGLNVSMADAFGMQSRNARGYVVHPSDCLLLLEVLAPLFHLVAEIASVAILER